MSAIKLPLIAFTLALGVLPACSFSPGDDTKGELGNVSFSYHESCFWGCGLDQPVLRASTERIFVTGPGNAADIVASSSAPEIASFTEKRMCSCDRSSGSEAESYSATADTTCNPGFTLTCENYFDVETGNAGDAKLELKDGKGNLVDRVTVHVRDAGTIRMARVPEAGGDQTVVTKLELTVGESAEVVAQPFTSDGRAMVGEHGFAWQTADPSVAGFDYAWNGAISQKAPDDARIVHVRAVAPGNTELGVDAGGATGIVQIVVK